MKNAQPQEREDRLLVFNCHEPWVYQLGVLGYKLDIIIGLKGRYHETWDERMRPLPANSQLITLQEAVRSPISYYCIITHNITDLLDIKSRREPRLIVLHSTLEGRVAEEKPAICPNTMKQMLQRYLKFVGGHAVATSMFKGESWGLTEDIVTFGIDPDDYPPYSGEVGCGLRICNFIESRKKILLWDLHEKAFGGIPMKLVGHNPTVPGVTAAENWDHLKSMLRSHRFYVHTADPRFEAGYNMGMAEAMAAGLPVLGNCHPTSLVKHGVNGFLSDDPAELRRYAKLLLDNKNLAAKMGQQARQTIVERFSIVRFKRSFLRSIELAREKWYARAVGR